MVKLEARESLHRGCLFFSLVLLPVASFHYAIEGAVLVGWSVGRGLEWGWIDKRELAGQREGYCMPGRSGGRLRYFRKDALAVNVSHPDRCRRSAGDRSAIQCITKRHDNSQHDDRVCIVSDIEFTR